MVSEDWIEKSHDSWSVFKIMGELVEGYEKLSQLGPCVSIFGSARTKPDDKYYKKTIEISEDIVKLGLGYITLGQQSTTLSGGESQRIKLATELSKKDTGKTMYIFDEPTTGLHFEDIKVFLDIIFELSEKGNSIIIIEHNIDVLKVSDYIIELGPNGGKNGGKITFQGKLKEIFSDKKSITGQFIKKELNL